MPGDEFSSATYFHGSLSTTNLSGAGTSSTTAWPNKKDDYELQDPIGVGATATVYKVFNFFLRILF